MDNFCGRPHDMRGGALALRAYYHCGMFKGTDWITDWHSAEAFSLRISELCAAVPLRGAWEPNDRIALVIASFRLAQEHHGSIHLLTSHDRLASANALARPLAEAALRTIWIAEDANNQVIVEILEGRYELPRLGKLNDVLSNRTEKMSKDFQRLLHSFTHGGTTALASQFLEGEEREKSRSTMIALAGLSLGSAGYMAMTVLGLHDMLEQLARSIPGFD